MNGGKDVSWELNTQFWNSGEMLGIIRLQMIQGTWRLDVGIIVDTKVRMMPKILQYLN